MSVLLARGLDKAFGDRVILQDAGLQIEPGEHVGLVGVNGAGKSTLLKILSGREPADRGEVLVQRAGSGLAGGLAYLAQEPELPGETVGDALDEALGWHRRLLSDYEQALEAEDVDRMAVLQEELDQHGWDLQHRVESMARRLETPPRERSLEGLSGGERRRIALARALLGAPDLLVLDEPTNHLDMETITWLEGWLKGWRGALLLVTHDRYLLESVTTRILEVERGQVFSYPGSYADYLVASAERRALEEKTRSRMLDLIEREAAWASRSPAARTTKQRGRLKRLEDLRESLPASAGGGELELMLPAPVRKGGTLFEARGLRKRLGDRLLIRDLELILRPGDRVGIVGPNGCGKSTLLKIVQGSLAPDAGEVLGARRGEMAFLDQGRSGLSERDSVFEAAGSGNSHVFLGDQAIHVASFLRRLQFPRESLEQPVSTLSGGERARLLMAKMLLQGASLLLLDEPTNDLDLLTLRVLEETLLEFPGAVLLVTHDRSFLDRVCTSILSFEEQGQIRSYASRQQLQRSERSRAEPPAPKREKKKAPAAAPRPKPVKLSYRERQELDALPDQIESAEEQITSLGEALSRPELYREESDRVGELTRQLEILQGELEGMYARWEELDARS